MGELDLAPPDLPEESVYDGRNVVFRSRAEKAGWVVLLALLAATLVAALTFDRSKLPLHGDEATYALQAASLARDLDLAYTKADLERFVEAWGIPPDSLLLQSRAPRPGSPDAAGPLVYAKPPLYALATAPFVALAPVRGGVIANALFLAAAALLAARSLRRGVGGAAPWWVALFLFGSIAFAQVFWGEADLFLLAATASGFALVYGGGGESSRGSAARVSIYQGEETGSATRSWGRWLAAGALLAIPVVYRPLYAVLWLPALLAAAGSARGRRASALAGLVAGGLAVAALSAGLQYGAGGDWSGYGGDRRGLYGSTVTRSVDLETGTWAAPSRAGSGAAGTPSPPRHTATTASASWFERDLADPRWDARLLGWNGLYALAGRNLGLLPYFLPLLLGFTAYRGERGRWALPLAVLAALATLLTYRPFNFFGGGPFGDRYFLPLYPALWFVAARPARVLPAILVALGAAPFLYILWLHPRTHPVDPNAGFRHVTPVARRVLPFETTQQGLPGAETATEGGLWVKLLDANAWTTSGGRFRVAGAEWTELLLASPQPLAALHLEFGASAPTKLEVGGEILRPLMLKADGGVLFSLPLGEPDAVHPTAWSRYDHSFYRLRFRLPGAPSAPIGFRLRPAHALHSLIDPVRSR